MSSVISETVRLPKVEYENFTTGLPEVDFLFYQDKLEVKKLMPSIYPALWVIHNHV